MNHRSAAGEPARIGLAISGGGHRATIYALGALLYLVDSGWNTRVQTIASVSGGSILNAFVALIRGPDGGERSFRSFEPGEFDPHAAALAASIAGRPAIWTATAVAMLVAVVSSLVLLGVTTIDDGHVVAGMAVVLLGLALLLGPRAGGSLWGWWGTWAYCGSFLWLAPALVVSSGMLGVPGLELLAALALGTWGLQRRNWVAERAFDHLLRMLAARPGPGARWRSPSLETMSVAVRHIFCATELHSGQHAFFSRDLVYARGFGLGRPGSLPVATAMQVSANFPGGFPIRPLRTERFAFFLTDRFEEVSEHGIRMGRDILMPDEDIAWMNRHQQFLESDRPLPRRLMLTDGGVFDNLAVDWFLRSEERLDRFRMSLNWAYDTTTGERQNPADPREDALLEPIRDDSDCLIIVNAGVTSHWRHGLESSVLLPFVGEAMGFSQVTSTMYNNYTKKRIAELEEHVVVEMGFAERLVRTTLLPLGRAATASLLEAGYWQTRTAIELKFGRASTSGPDEEPIQAMLDRSARLTARCERLSRGLIEDAGGTTDEERG